MKIAIINQRYGNEINGGSELYTRITAERLCKYYDIEVLTTCALEYTTWEDYYQSGNSIVNGVKVKRFKVSTTRDPDIFGEVHNRLLTTEFNNLETQQEWIDKQGPYCPELINYIQDNADEYDVFIFITYLYYLTARGLQIVSKKAILVPTAHDEPYIYLHSYNDVFLSPKAIVYLTEEEKKIVENQFYNSNIKNEVIGTGIQVSSQVNADAFKEKYELSSYIIYVGRIDEGKNCHVLFDYFIRYKQHYPSDLKLVLMGKSVMNIPDHKDILNLGFVEEYVKDSGIAGAKVMIMPSQYESLSFSVLESLYLRTPVIVNELCDVLKGHCIRSNAGLYYRDYFDFSGCMSFLLNKEEIYKQMQDNGEEYVLQNYQWKVVEQKWKKMIDYVAGDIEYYQ